MLFLFALCLLLSVSLIDAQPSSPDIRANVARLLTRIKQDRSAEAFEESIELVKRYKEELDMPPVEPGWLDRHSWQDYLMEIDDTDGTDGLQRCAAWGADVIKSMDWDSLEDVIAEIYRCQLSVVQAEREVED